MNNSNPSLSKSIILDRVEAYDASTLNCYAFRRGSDAIEGHSLSVGNMVSGFPFALEGVTFQNSECAYIAGMFSDDTDNHLELQEALQAEANGFMAKKKIRRFNEDKKRTDWKEFNVQWMLYCVWCKVVNNREFRDMLLAIPSDAVIIEDSTFQNGATADIWGTKNATQRRLVADYKKKLEADGHSKAAIKRACDEKRLGEWRKQGVFVGKNLMGKILMLCRDAVLRGTTPDIDLELLRSKRIYLFGKLLTFDSIPTVGEAVERVEEAIILDQEEVYDPKIQNVWPFKCVDDIVEGIKLDLCNMTSCYPFAINGVKWRSSEELYLAGEFSNDTAEHRSIQEELRAARSPYGAKRFVKGKHRKAVRKDFTEFRTQWMLWCVWQKCKGNLDFRRKLLSIPEGVILIEETTTDTGGSGSIWGCSNRELVEARKTKAQSITESHTDLKKKNLAFLINVETNAIRNIGTFKGQNNIGKILMICRDCIKRGTEPQIDLDLLRSKNIFIFGKRLKF
ncbi:MAG: NADAR family protein [Lachnospiraceae bacterium]|nr:NADAR family protein [Lachnospiraceae bacterium]